MSEDAIVKFFSTFIQLEKASRHVNNLAELYFIICNETKKLVDYKQAVVFSVQHDKTKIEAISATAEINQDAPFIIWLNTVMSHLVTHQKITTVSANDLPPNLQKDWQKWLPQYALFCPLLYKDKTLLGGIWLTKPTPWQENETTILSELTGAYAHAWHSVKYSKKISYMNSWWRQYHISKILFVAIILAMFLPVRLSVLAPAEIVARDPFIVSSPIDGVIKAIKVEPNQVIHQGDILFSLDDTDLRNRYQVSNKILAVAEEKYRKAIQHAFDNSDSKRELLLLKLEAEKKKAELQYTKEMLNKVNIHAIRNGLAIFADKNEWLGKPVHIGERVMLIANPKQKEIDIWLPIEEAIALHKNANVTLFLNRAPLHPFHAKLKYISYSAVKRPNNTYAYLLKATIKTSSDIEQIGARGTAKIYAEKVSLFYYLFRKPLSFLRQYFGV